MSIIATHLTTSGGSGASSYTTASIAPGANRLILAAVSQQGNAGDATVTLSGNGLTWVQVANVVSVTGTRQFTLFRTIGSSPSSGVVTITCSATNIVMWSISEFNGIDISGTNGSGALVQSATRDNEGNADTSTTITLGAFSNAANATFGALYATIDALTISAGTNFTLLSNITSPQSIGSEWRNDNATSVVLTYPSNSDIKLGLACEIKADLAGGGALFAGI